MAKTLKAFWLAGCGLLALLFFVSCFTAFIPASRFSFAVFFALLFPYLFAAVAAAVVINLFISKRWAAGLSVLLLCGLYNFFLTVAVSPFSTWKMKKDSGCIRVMTWNVSDFTNPAPLNLPDAAIRRKMLNTISEYNPDILCLQEYLTADNSRDLPSERHELDSLGFTYSAFSGDQELKTFYGLIRRGVIVLSKTPIVDSGQLQIRRDVNRENFTYADVLVGGKKMRVGTAHLVSFYIFPDSARGYDGKKTVAKKLYTYKHTVEAKLRDVERTHEVQVGIIKSCLDTSTLPVIYCGDMNATPVMNSYQSLKGNKQDAFLQRGNGIGATFYKIAPTLRIDVCFPDDHFTVKQCTVVQRRLGDHDPVVTDLTWKKP